MKNKIVLIAISLLSLIACKKSVTGVNGNAGAAGIVPVSGVPQAVVNSFTASFSTATETEWQHNSDDSFTCQFNMDDQRHEARFDDKGHESSHTIICLDAAVPGAVLDAFRTGFPSDIVYEWSLTNEGTWKAHFMRASIKWEVTFDGAGAIIKSEHN